MRLSIVFPAYNEEGNIKKTLDEAIHVLNREGYNWEILVIDNASTDKTGEIIDSYAKKYPSIRVIHHEHNMGYAASTDRGLKNAEGDIILTIDSDGQHTSEDIPAFVEKIKEGYDLVIGWKKDRKDSFFRNSISLMYNSLFRFSFKISFHEMNCGFKAFTKEAARSIKISQTEIPVGPEIVVRAKLLGYKMTELPVRHYPRKWGSSVFRFYNIPSKTMKVITSMLKLKKIYNQELNEKNNKKDYELEYDFYNAMKHGKFIERKFHRLRFKTLSKKLDKDKKTLEVGCGSGLFMIPLLKKGYDIQGCDISPKVIEMLKKNTKKENIFDKLNAKVADAAKLPYKDKSFEQVIMFSVLEHMENKNGAIKEAHRVLKDNGALLIEVPWKYNPVWHSDFIRKRFSGRRDIDQEPFHHSLDSKELRGLVEGTGFKTEKIKVHLLSVITGVFKK